MPQRKMVELGLDEVSGVDHPAHLLEGWLMMKSATGAPLPASVAALLATAESMAHTEARMPEPITKEARAALDPAVRDYLASLESEVAKATAPADSATEFEKALATLPEPVRKHLAEQQAQLAESQRVTKALVDDRIDKEFMEKAAGLTSLPGVNPREFAPLLRKMHEGMGEDAVKILEVLKNADTLITNSQMFGEIGSGHGIEGTPVGDIESVAKSYMTSDPELSYTDAISKAAKERPELYAAYRASAQSPGSAYVER